MAKVDNGDKMKVKLMKNGAISYMGEKVAKILQSRGEVKILGKAEEKAKEEKKESKEDK